MEPKTSPSGPAFAGDSAIPAESPTVILGSPRRDGDCGERELRGGSWFSAPAFVRPAYRNHVATGYRTSSVGFRLVRDNAP